jgi:hypothetical protein
MFRNIGLKEHYWEGRSGVNIKLFWPNCDFINKQLGGDKIDSYWVECTFEEAEKSIFPYLSQEQIEESKIIWDPKEKTDIEIDTDHLCYLVSKDLKSITPMPWYYPYSGMWNGYCPFVEIPKVEITELSEIKDLVAIKKDGRSIAAKKTSRTVLYKTELNQRYWAYLKNQFPAWDNFVEQSEPDGLRPPVFHKGEAWRNVIVDHNASVQKLDRLLSLVPDPERHKWFRSMNSSQALAQTIFGNLAVYGLLDSLADILDDDGAFLFGKAQLSSDNFAMEHKVGHLHEPRPTSLDAYIGGDYQVAIECKFTEPGVGTCSRPRLTPDDPNYELEYCDGTYSVQRARKERCSLAEAGVLYWDYIPGLFHWDKDDDVKPCPLDSKYQLVRNILAVGVKNGETSPANGHAVLIYDERNPAFQARGSGLIAFAETRKALQEPTMLRKCSLQRVVLHLRDRGDLPWLTGQLALKYGL